MEKYIKLSDVQNEIIETKNRIFDDLDQHNGLEISDIILNEINSLPSIEVESTFDEQIEEYQNYIKSYE